MYIFKRMRVTGAHRRWKKKHSLHGRQNRLRCPSQTGCHLGEKIAKGGKMNNDHQHSSLEEHPFPGKSHWITFTHLTIWTQDSQKPKCSNFPIAFFAPHFGLHYDLCVQTTVYSNTCLSLVNANAKCLRYLMV